MTRRLFGAAWEKAQREAWQRVQARGETDETTAAAPSFPLKSTVFKRSDKRQDGGAPARQPGFVSRFFGAKPQAKRQPTRREMLALRPVRNPALEWHEDEGRVVLHIKLPRNRLTKFVSIFSHIPDERSVELDAIGSDVWRLMDGQRTFGDIARALADQYKLAPREAELSLQQFFRDLARRGYAAFSRTVEG